MEIAELFQQELDFWTTTNQKFLGVTPIEENDDFEVIQKKIDEDCAKFWNTDKPCKLARNLNNGILNKDASKQTKNSYKLKLNFRNMCIDVYGEYSGKDLKICAIPTPCNDLCWIINRSHYVPRATAVRDYYTLVSKKDYETISGEGWSYSIRDKEFTCNITKEEYKFEPTKEYIFNNKLSNRSRALLQSRIDKPLTVDTFEEAMVKLPMFVHDSIFNYKFSRMEYFEDVVLNSNKYAQPTKDILLGFSDSFKSQVSINTDRSITIKEAICSSNKNDVVCICGKGHEDYMILGTQKVHFDDREEARKALDEKLAK